MPGMILMTAMAVLCHGLAPAETISIMIKVTPENSGHLDDHHLEIKGDSRNGITHLMIRIRPEKGYQLQSCHATIHNATASKPPVLASFKLDVHGEFLYFSVADELVDRVSLNYQLNAEPLYSAVFDIEAGQLRKLMSKDEP